MKESEERRIDGINRAKGSLKAEFAPAIHRLHHTDHGLVEKLNKPLTAQKS